MPSLLPLSSRMMLRLAKFATTRVVHDTCYNGELQLEHGITDAGESTGRPRGARRRGMQVRGKKGRQDPMT
jgi:hypothetical protein